MRIFWLIAGLLLVAMKVDAQQLPPLPVPNQAANQTQLAAGPQGAAQNSTMMPPVPNSAPGNANSAQFINQLYDKADVDHFEKQEASTNIFTGINGE